MENHWNHDRKQVGDGENGAQAARVSPSPRASCEGSNCRPWPPGDESNGLRLEAPPGEEAGLRHLLEEWLQTDFDTSKQHRNPRF